MKKTQIKFLTMTLVLAAILFLHSEATAQTRVNFNSGGEASVSGNVSRAQARRYVFAARAGQQISIVLDSEAASSMKITVTNNRTGERINDESAAETGDMREQTFNAELPEGGDYTVTITSSDNEAASFELNLTRN